MKEGIGTTEEIKRAVLGIWFHLLTAAETQSLWYRPNCLQSLLVLPAPWKGRGHAGVFLYRNKETTWLFKSLIQNACTGVTLGDKSSGGFP